MHLRQLIPALAALVVIGLTASLGRWQLQRADEKARAAEHRQTALNRAPVALAPDSKASALDGALVSVQGQWLEEKTIFLDNRTRQGVAGFHVVTPLRLNVAQQATDIHVLVLRGWVAREVSDRTRLPQFKTPSDPVRVEGMGLIELPQPIRLARGLDVDPAAPRIWQHLDPQAYSRWSGLPLHALMLRQLSDADDGLMRDWTLPGSGEDKHRAYAFQWFAMSGVTALLWIGLTLRRRRHHPGCDPAAVDPTSHPENEPGNDPKTDSKTDPKTDSKTDPKTDSKTDPKTDSKNNSSAPP